MSLALLKLPLVLVAGFSFASTAVSPQKQVATSHEQQKYEKELNTSVLGIPQSSAAWLIPRTYKYIAIAMTITEAAFVLADAFRTTPLGEAALEYLCQRPGARVSISPLFLFGVLGSVVGSYIRFTCYRELGALFTYELTVRDGHKLITTGPYAIVRHPSYTGLVIKFAGVTACALASGSWWAESGIRLTVVGKAVEFIWLSVLVAITFVILRAGNEDAMLRTEFGDEWEVYARKVRYRYVPLVL